MEERGREEGERLIEVLSELQVGEGGRERGDRLVEL
jgi:hypothetical protein